LKKFSVFFEYHYTDIWSFLKWYKQNQARIFPLSYAAARLIVKKAGNLVSIHVRHHDLRYAATYASRSGTPLEIVSKVLLRHSNLSTTQKYLGKLSDAEPMRWIDNCYPLVLRVVKIHQADKT